MGIAIAFLVSFVALFTFGSFKEGQFQKPWQKPAARDIVDWNRQSQMYRPDRKSVMSDPDGNARRTADGTQMTRRDRGREFWSMESVFGVRTAETFKNFTAKNRHPKISYSQEPRESMQQAAQPVQRAAELTMDAPMETSAPPIESIAPEPITRPAMPAPAPVSAPLHQNQVETISVVPPMPVRTQREISYISAGRLVKNAISASESIPDAEKISVQVSQAGNKVILKGVVLSMKSKILIQDIARKIVGNDYEIENRIVAINA